MAFNSLEYLVFFIVVLLASWTMISFPRLRIWFLLLASYYFYASNNGWIVGLLFGSTLIDYYAGLGIEKTTQQAKKKLYLIVSLVANLGVLGFFKYFNFFADSAYAFLQMAGLDVEYKTLSIVLPVGISFYTFQSMSYTIDVYRGIIPAEKSFYRFAFYVAFFPQLVAGPIVRARYFLHQLDQKFNLTRRGVDAAFFFIFLGLFKKLVLADTLGLYVDPVFNNPDKAHGIAAWLALYAFSFQIYFDFSGYTDVAIGCARLLGYRLPPNFKRPYAALSFSEFWRRWHLSLSYWLRDYLYIPLGGSRSPDAWWGVYRNLMIVMFLAGLWHGAAWSFVLWGIIHGAALCIERALGAAKFVRDYRDAPVRRIIRAFMIFNMITLTWLPFRIDGMEDLKIFAAQLTDFSGGISISYGMLLATLIIAVSWGVMIAADFFSFRRWIGRWPVWLKAAGYAGVAITVIVFTARGTSPFIYFAF